MESLLCYPGQGETDEKAQTWIKLIVHCLVSNQSGPFLNTMLCLNVSVANKKKVRTQVNGILVDHADHYTTSTPMYQWTPSLQLFLVRILVKPFCLFPLWQHNFFSRFLPGEISSSPKVDVSETKQFRILLCSERPRPRPDRRNSR